MRGHIGSVKDLKIGDLLCSLSFAARLFRSVGQSSHAEGICFTQLIFARAGKATRLETGLTNLMS